jgi:hypothetical protein
MGGAAEVGRARSAGRRSRYALCALAVLAIEALIALFVHDSFVRPLVGDSLAVILVYLLVRAVTAMRLRTATSLSLGIAFAIELSQLFGMISHLGLDHNRMARVVLGSQFDPLDLIAYVAGAACIVAGEALAARTRADVR